MQNYYTQNQSEIMKAFSYNYDMTNQFMNGLFWPYNACQSNYLEYDCNKTSNETASQGSYCNSW